MVPILVILTLVVFIIVDLALRKILKSKGLAGYLVILEFLCQSS